MPVPKLESESAKKDRVTHCAFLEINASPRKLDFLSRSLNEII